MFGGLAAGFLGAESLTPESFMVRPPNDDHLTEDERIEKQVAFLKAALGPGVSAQPLPPAVPPPEPPSVAVKRAPLPPKEPGRTLQGSPFGPRDDAPPRPRAG